VRLSQDDELVEAVSRSPRAPESMPAAYAQVGTRRFVEPASADRAWRKVSRRCPKAASTHLRVRCVVEANRRLESREPSRRPAPSRTLGSGPEHAA